MASNFPDRRPERNPGSGRRVGDITFGGIPPCGDEDLTIPDSMGMDNSLECTQYWTVPSLLSTNFPPWGVPNEEPGKSETELSQVAPDVLDRHTQVQVPVQLSGYQPALRGQESYSAERWQISQILLLSEGSPNLTSKGRLTKLLAMNRDKRGEGSSLRRGTDSPHGQDQSDQSDAEQVSSGCDPNFGEASKRLFIATESFLSSR